MEKVVRLLGEGFSPLAAVRAVGPNGGSAVVPSRFVSATELVLAFDEVWAAQALGSVGVFSVGLVVAQGGVESLPVPLEVEVVSLGGAPWDALSGLWDEQAGSWDEF